MIVSFIKKWPLRIKEYREFLSFLQGNYYHYKRVKKISERYSCIINHSSSFTGDIDSLAIGKGTSIGANCYFRFREGKITIGENVLFGNNVNVIATERDYKKQDVIINKQDLKRGEVIIGDDVWIGTQAIILPNVTIGKGAVIGAGAVVTKNVPDYEVWAGNPASCISRRSS